MGKQLLLISSLHFSFFYLSKIPIIKHLFGKENGSLNRTIKITPTHKKMFYIPFSKIVTRKQKHPGETLSETSSVSGKMQRTKSKLSWHWFVPRLELDLFLPQHNQDWRKKRHEIPTPTLPLYSLRIQIRTCPAIFRVFYKDCVC